MNKFIKRAIVLVALYSIYDFLKIKITGVPDSSQEIWFWTQVGYFLHVTIFWVILPRFLYKKVKSLIVFAVSKPQPDPPLSMIDLILPEQTFSLQAPQKLGFGLFFLGMLLVPPLYFVGSVLQTMAHP